MRKRKKRKLKRLETIEGAQEIALPHLTMILDSGKLPEKLKLQGWTLEDMKELQPLLE
jgi:Zn-finger domain-containing protein